MARLLHLSDLHFGAHNQRLVDAVERDAVALAPDLVVVSGDFTQRARTEQFREACSFLERLRDSGLEVLGVPGNHDVPLYDVLRRFLSPLARYRRFIDETLCPFVELSGVAVLGINTARSLTFKDGRINADQVQFIRDTFARSPSESMRVLVTHHPLFAQRVGAEELGTIGRQQLALDAVEDAGVDILLAGHNHHASAQDAGDLVTRAGGTLVIRPARRPRHEFANTAESSSLSSLSTLMTCPPPGHRLGLGAVLESTHHPQPHRACGDLQRGGCFGGGEPFQKTHDQDFAVAGRQPIQQGTNLLPFFFPQGGLGRIGIGGQQPVRQLQRGTVRQRRRFLAHYIAAAGGVAAVGFVDSVRKTKRRSQG